MQKVRGDALMKDGLRKLCISTVICVGALTAVHASPWEDDDEVTYARVLLLSIDGMHAVDLARW
jgi:hypothetical protein